MVAGWPGTDKQSPGGGFRRLCALRTFPGLMSESGSSRCASCGAALTGQFCSECGAPAASRRCQGCAAALTADARFCHRCGRPAAAPGGIPPHRERVAWLGVLAVAIVTTVAVALQVERGRVPPPTVPVMGNAGNAGPAARAPDISRMSPRERFDRLFDRVVSAAERRQPDTVALFAPMALGAYAQLDEVDPDARYHAAMIHLAVGELAEARALADTIATEHPRHLFAPLIRGEAAEAENDVTALSNAYRAFLESWDAEQAANRREYRDHAPVLEDFRVRALANRTSSDRAGR